MKLPSDAIPGPEVRIDGTSYLYFGGTGYLGMQRDPEFLDRYASHTRAIGTHWGSSRAGNLVLPVYGRAESALAHWMGSPSCLTLSSGFLSGRLLSEHFNEGGFKRFFSPNCHEALLAEGGQRAPDWGTLYADLTKFVTDVSSSIPVVFTDTMGGPHHDGPVWQKLAPLPRECILIADDSHGLGVTGPEGSGSWKPLQRMGFRELLLCGSLGKAMGITAGILAGPSERLDALRNTSFFSGASPAPPAGLAVLTETLENGRYRDQFQRLSELLLDFQEAIEPLEFLNWVPNYPVITFRNRSLAEYLNTNRILFTDFDYSAEGGATSPSRIVVTAAHKRQHLDRLANALLSFEDSH